VNVIQVRSRFRNSVNVIQVRSRFFRDYVNVIQIKVWRLCECNTGKIKV
jgi:hypothetical protein